MCLLAFSYASHPRYRLALVGNRDEFYARPTRPAHRWEDAPFLLAGRDLSGGGTWLGLTEGGRFATVTNYRDLRHLKDDAPSRGDLTKDFLLGSERPSDYLKRLAPKAGEYNGFNLLVGDFSEGGEGLFYLSNYDRGGVVRQVEPGLHGLSNALLDTPWPKTEKAKAALAALLEAGEPSPQGMADALRDEARAPDSELPDTGVGLERERMLSPMFISSPDYGTRCVTALLVTYGGDATFFERTYASERDGPISGGAQERKSLLTFT